MNKKEAVSYAQIKATQKLKAIKNGSDVDNE